MTDQATEAMASRGTAFGGPRPVLKVLRDQRKTLLVAMALVAVTCWITFQMGTWLLTACTAGGVALGLVNHLATEYWLLRVITSGQQPTRNTMIVSTTMRLLVLTAVAVGIAVTFWPEGIGLLLGLAVFRLVALVMTGLPLLKELKKP
ncbi:MAG: hypothetical protein ACRDOJ_14530 [Nocardioidaceae bacterium]